MSEAVPFAGVPAGLKNALISKGFSELTLVQKAVLAPGLEGRDLRISSTTGSGKTVALGFALAAELEELPRAVREKRPVARPRVLVMAPTRELAAQIHGELSWLLRPIGVRLAVVTGGTSIGGDFRALAAQPHVLIATPGRLRDHLERGSADLAELRAAVLDEADEMLDMGFREDLTAILEGAPEERRTHLVSATFPREVLQWVNRYQRDAVHIEGTRAGTANQDIAHVGIAVRGEDKLSALINLLLATPGEKSLVFVRTRATTSGLAGKLGNLGFAASALSGDMSQRERTATLEAFRVKAVECLVATDVAARGLDISDVAQVIHFDLPENPSVFTHRSGRTGRAGKKGTSFVFVPPSARGRVQHMLSRARVKLDWGNVPTPEQLRAKADERLLAEFEAGNETGAASTSAPAADKRLLAVAQKLLDAGDPVATVAALLARTSYAGPCEPRRVRPVSFDRGGDRGRERSGRDRRPYERGGDRRGQGGGGRGQNSGRGRGQNSDRGGDFTPFYVSWGANNGANPSRLLAVVCRRGDVRSGSIGAIRIGDHRSVVEVASHLAEQFAAAASKPDSRNPWIKIRPWREGPAARDGRSGGGGKHGAHSDRGGDRPGAGDNRGGRYGKPRHQRR